MLLCREAAFSALQRTYPTGIPELPLRDNTGPTVQIADFDSAMKHVKPTGMREFMVEVPSHLTWKNLGGLSSVKTIITEEVIESIRNPEIFRSIGIRPVKGILLYGPPGTGKTLLAKIIANEAGTNFIPIKGPEILSKWFGESEQRIRQIFSKAREVSPCVIFFDEIDAIFSSRGNYATEASDRVVNQLLTEMDGFESSEGVYVIAATNRFELLDPAFLRPGRFDYQIFLPLPDVEMRKEIFRIHLAGKPITDQIDLEELAKKSEGFSGAHIAEVCRRSGITALKNSGFGKSEIRITMQHLLDAIGTIRFSIEKLEHPHSGVEFA
jgi:transitional endoplasmic reticulum ATPase